MAIFDPTAALRAELDKAMEPLRQAILAGNPSSYEKYREAVGELRGLQRAYQAALQMTGAQQLGVFGNQLQSPNLVNGQLGVPTL